MTRKRTFPIGVAILLPAMLLFGTPGHAQTFNGRFTTAVYAFQRAPGSSGTADHLRAYQTVNLTLARLLDSRLSLQVYGFINTDLLANTVDDPRIWLYNAYLKYLGHFGQVRLGRQRVFAGVGFGTIDGIRLIGRVTRYAELDIFAGTQMPLTEGIGLDSWKDSHMFGVRLRTMRWERTRVSLSFVEKSRSRRVYLQPGEFTADY